MSRPGFESRLLARLPEILLAGVVPGAVCAVLASDDFAAIVALSFTVAWGLSLLPVAFACLIVRVMKGPVRTADSYPLPGSEPKPSGRAP